MFPSAKTPCQLFHAISFHKQHITGANINVAVMDSGLAPHPDLSSNRILAFEDFTNKTFRPAASYYDDYSHGTHVTGILASEQIGIAPQCNIISLKVLDQHGNGSLENFIDAVKWILYHKHSYPIHIVNISIGSNHPDWTNEHSPLNDWVNALWEQGLIVCCSAGNQGPFPNSITAPGSCKKVITVGSSNGKHYSSSGIPKSHITKPELVAPGTNILSLKPGGGYHYKSGTSMSVPFVSGACALLLQCNPNLTNDQIKIRLMHACTPLSNLPRNMQGAGLLSLNRLLSDYT